MLRSWQPSVATGDEMWPRSALALGLETGEVMAELFGKKTGVTGGRGGSMHLADVSKNFWGGYAIVSGHLLLSVGLGFASNYLEEDRVTVCFFGDGATNAGAFHEAMNLAGVRRLPVVFICDNNQWAYSTPTHLEYACEHLADRAQAYGFEGVVVDGTDVLAVYREAKRAIEKAREGGGPTLIESQTLRMEGHAVHDDAFYVPKEMFEEWAKRDPIERFRTWLRENADMTDDEEGEIGVEIKKIMNDAIRRAEESPLPDPTDVTERVFASPEDLDTPHHK
jgi:TPP-dependent pyruvate/acetoin dehydrogenase alpha subunit